MWPPSPTFEEMEQFYADVLAVTDENNDAIQQELVNVLALGEPAAKALIPKPNLSPPPSSPPRP